VACHIGDTSNAESIKAIDPACIETTRLQQAGIILYMKVMMFRGFRLVSFVTLFMFVVVACSGPDGGSNRTSSESGAESDPTPTLTEQVSEPTTEPASDDPAPDPVETSVDEALEPDPTAASDAEPTATSEPEQEPTATEAADEPTATPEPSPTSEPTATPESTPPPPVEVEGSLFPDHRIIAYYGHPSTPLMGILGEYSKEELLQVLMEQVAEYEAADPDTTVIPAFELIATVAQPEPQSDGTYLLYTGDPWIQEYVDFTAENNMLLFLDLQIGHSTIRDQLGLIWHWLQYPHVHVAIDPEFATGPTHPPGTIIGGVDAGHVNIAIEALSELVIQNDLPPKILILHQFTEQMIRNKEDIRLQPGVDFVLHMDGWGYTEAKVANYHHFVRDQLIQWGGFKIFYRQDIPVMTAEEVLSMEPPPLFISYQ
jgi:hypothetical protein